MGSITPLAAVVIIMVLASIAGVVAAFVRERKLLSGYEEIEEDVLLLKRKLGAEVFREGADLVVSGSENKVPVVVRFSLSENTPGLNIRLHGPATMNLAVIPKNSSFYFPPNLRLQVNTPDDMFNARYMTRTDEGAAARMFLMGRQTMKELQKSLCSSRTTLSITHGALELNETTIPQPYTGSHVSGHIESMLRMSSLLAEMPGAQLAAVQKPERPRHLLMRSAIALGVLAAVLSIIGAVRSFHEPIVAVPVDPTKIPNDMRGAGVLAVDAPLINSLEEYRVVLPPEMDQSAASELRANGAEPEGRTKLQLSGGEENGAGYLLTDVHGRRRIVIVNKGKLLFDTRNFGPALIAKVPKDDFSHPLDKR